ncbi:MAG TPA: AAA family ATPase [Pirellulales bacterium]|jgi:MoxR-like ATPase|nr:AAA family ATPase [Pirellulales bacterium]
MATPLEIARRLNGEILNHLKSAFVGKDEVLDLLGVCLVASEHLFILGPPGTAKSAIVHQLARRLEGRVFDYLLTRFTEPNELFGPFDIRKLREGELLTNTEGMLPEASFVFLDELLNANSAILNSLLMVLNERIFRRGRETRALPLLMVVGASNRLPEEDALAALFDRFLLRVRCDNVPDERLAEVLSAGWRLEQAETPDGPTISVEEIRAVQLAVRDIDLLPVREAFVELVARLRKAGIEVSDRRAVKLQRLIAASALLCGRLAAQRTDLWVLRYIWDTEEQREVLAALVQELLSHAEPEQWPVSHPRARDTDGPDAEELARDLNRLSAAWDSEAMLAADRAAWQDQLAILAGRCQWVRDEQQRSFLQQQVDSLWKQAS